MMIFPNTSVFDISKKIIDDLNNYIHPVSIRAQINMGTTPKQAIHIKNQILNTSHSFSGQEATIFFHSVLDSIEGHENKNKYLTVYIQCQTLLTFYKNNDLVSEWFPSAEYYDRELKLKGNRYLLQAPISIHLEENYFSLSIFTDIWEPRFKNDKLATINGERLTHILKTIEGILHPTKSYFEGNEKITNSYGYKRPDEIFQ
jgi:hypothetical protein